jgi:hypothetical protein
MLGHAHLGLLLAAMAVAMGSVGGCGRRAGRIPEEPPRLSGGSGSAAVTYRPETHVLEREEGYRAFRGTSSDGWALLFDSKDPKLQSLKTGDVLLIKGLLARKVVAADVHGSRVLVLTRLAALGEAIQDGRIRLNAPIRFTRSSSRHAFRLWAVPALSAQSPEQVPSSDDPTGQHAVSGEFQGWETTFTVVPGAGRLDISLTLRKDVGGFRALITGQGYLADFGLSSGIDVERSVVQQLQLAHKNLNGVMNFKWEVAKDSPGALSGDDRIKLPAAITIPLYQYLGGFPLFLDISSAIIIKPAISGGNEYSRGAFRITYDGYQSFQAKEGNIDASGNVTGDIAFLESQNISAMAPMGMVVAFAAPRIELSFGVSKIFKFGDMKEASGAVDKLADEFAKHALGKEGYDRWKSSPPGQFSMGQNVANAMASDAAGYIELVSSSGMSNSGMSAIFPCTRTDLHFWVKVGASAQTFGLQLGKVEQEIFKKDFTRIDPPGTKLCEQVGA